MAARRKSGIIQAGCVIIAGLSGILLSGIPAGYRLNKKVVVITGGSRGLGLAMAREFALQGAELVLLSRDKEELWRASLDLFRSKAHVSTWQCDVRETSEVERIISAIAEEYGHIDC